MTNQGWHDVRTYLGHVPPVELAEVVELADRRASAGGTAPSWHGRRWVLIGVTTIFVALAAVVIVVSRDRTHDTSITAGQGQVAAEDATYTIAGAQLISNALVIDDELWVTAVVDGTPTLTALDLRDRSQVRAIELPGEATVGGMVLAKGQLWLVTVDELGTTGTGLVRVDPSSGQVQQLGDLDRAATLATDGNLIWVRGQALLQTRSATTGELIDQRTDLGFGWITAHDGHAWTTDRQSSTVTTLDGVTSTNQQEITGDELLERPAWFHGRLFIAHGNDLDVLDPISLDQVDRIDVDGQPGLLVPTTDSLFALVDTPSSPTGPAQLLQLPAGSNHPAQWQLPAHEALTTLAVADDHTVIVCNTADTCRRYLLTP